MGRYGTHPGNADKHPGHVVLAADGPRKCRSPEEMAQVRREQEAQTKAREEERQMLVRRIAELEKQSKALENASISTSTPPGAKSKPHILTVNSGTTDIYLGTQSDKKVPKARRADIDEVCTTSSSSGFHSPNSFILLLGCDEE